MGREVKWQSKELFGQYPDALVACVGGGSNAIGLFYPFLKDTKVAIYGVEAQAAGFLHVSTPHPYALPSRCPAWSENVSHG